MSELKNIYPTRTPVWWTRRGFVELNRNEPGGVTGRLIVIRIWKESKNVKGFARIFNLLENLMFKITKGPKDFEEEFR